MIQQIDASTGCELLRYWGVKSWSDPGAEYFIWSDCCVFALVLQPGFVDVHIAMDVKSRSRCREAGEEMLRHIGHLRLRAIVLPDRHHVCNYARRMGFSKESAELLTDVDGNTQSFFIMWREPGVNNGRSN